jgi:endonuclease/exonuclease/phosphatase family metal-dependent hydrolase
VLSYNLYGWNALVQNPWKADNIVALINEVQPDFLSAQETEGQADSVRARLTGNYALAGAEQHGVAIFYDADTWELLADGIANLNEMDQWGQRIVRWGYFQHRGLGDRLYVFDTHWCVCSAAQLRGSAATVVAQIQARADQGAPVVFTGDLNVFEGFEGSEAVRYLKGELGSPLALVDTFRVIHPSADGSTFGAAGKIDYIFASPGLTVQDADILRGRIPPGSGSDHEPVVATVVLP